MQSVDWENSRIEELNICGTELLTETLITILTKLRHLRWLDASWLENMNDSVSESDWFTFVGMHVISFQKNFIVV